MTKLPIEEYRKRSRSLQAQMEKENLEVLLVYGWKRGQIRYFSGYYPNYVANVALLVLPQMGDPAMFIRFPFDLERAQRESWIEHIAASGNVLNLALDAANWLKQEGMASGRVGLVAGDHIMDEMPHSLYLALEKELPQASLVQAEHLFCEARMIKNPKEFDQLRESARIADVGVKAALETMQVGVSELEPVTEAEYAMRKMGAGESLVVIASKGDRELIGPPERKFLEDGDNVIFELAVELDGYWVQTAQTFYVGRPTEDQRAIYQAAYQAYQAGVEAARPGNTCTDVALAAKGILKKAGYGDYIEQDYGHGIGLDLPELPRIELEDYTQLEVGMALVIHPAVRIRGVGGAFIGGTVLIDQKGSEALHNIDPNPS